MAWKTAIGLLVAAVMVLSSCGLNPQTSGISYYDEEEVFVYEETPADASVRGGEATARFAFGRRRFENFRYRFFRVAQTQAVTVGSQDVQANDIVIDGEQAFVTYNYALDPVEDDFWAGALQVIDFSSNPRRPRIIVELGLPHADVNAIAVTSDYVYIAGAWDPNRITDYTSPDRAFVARIARSELASVTEEDIDAGKTILPGFAANGVTVSGDTVYVSTGATQGGLQILSADLELQSSVDADGATAYTDLRDVESYEGGVVVLQGAVTESEQDPDPQSSPGKILTLGADGSLDDSLEITGFGSADAKATIEVYDEQYAFLGLSAAGFEAYYLGGSDPIGTPLHSEPNPTGIEWTSEQNTATNSASYSGDLLFTSNGEAGFRVFEIDGSFSPSDSPSITLKGFVPFDETDDDGDGIFWSANHVEYRVNRDLGPLSVGYLAVASGVGGVNFYYLISR